MDNLSKEHRRKNMQNIHSKNTKIEVLVRSILHKQGYRFRIHTKIIGKPDITFPKNKVAIFIDSCFFHKCRYHYVQPKSNTSYWIPKIERNVERAHEVNNALKKQGWKILRIWEHQIKKDPQKYVNKIIELLNE